MFAELWIYVEEHQRWLKRETLSPCLLLIKFFHRWWIQPMSAQLSMRVDFYVFPGFQPSDVWLLFILSPRACSRVEKLFLQAIVAENERTGVEETNFISVYRQFQSFCALSSMFLCEYWIGSNSWIAVFTVVLTLLVCVCVSFLQV